ncbi:MAG TPA: recombinase RecB [Thermoproteales archaeon]|nr:recombinase RecB [Thermoproteales archaeon]
MNPRLKGKTVEELATALLEGEGFRILERRKVIRVGESQVAEVDILAEKDGEVYAVEVKSGRISVTDVRQAFTNARLLGYKPLIVCRGFTDKAAEATAKALGVEVKVFPDFYFFASPEELYRIIERAVYKVITDLSSARIEEIDLEALEVLKSIAFSRSWEEAAQKLEVKEEEFKRILGRLRRKGLITVRGDYDKVRAQALFLLSEFTLIRLLEFLTLEDVKGL